jgi:hypothetical protein
MYTALLCQSKELPPVVHNVQHHIETEGWPLASGWTQLSWQQPNRSSPRWSGKVLFAVPAHSGHQCCQVAVVTATFLKCGSLKIFLAVEIL